MDRTISEEKVSFIDVYQNHVSPGKVEFYKKYKMDFVMGKRERSREATDQWREMVQNLPGRRHPTYIYRRYWERQNTRAGIRVF